MPNLVQVSLPDSLTAIGSRVFSNAVSLENIDLPAGLKSIGSQAFFGCQSLSEADLPEGLESLGMMPFAGCGSMQHVTLPASLTKISHGCFASCYSLEEVEFPATVTDIYESAFENCENLREIRFNGAAPTIVYNAFAGVNADAYYNSSLDGWNENTLKDYGGSLNWIKTDQPAKVTNLQWGWCPEYVSYGQTIPAHEENGMISFTANEAGYYELCIYRVEEDEDVQVMSWGEPCQTAGTELCSNRFIGSAGEFGSGSYYFTVQALNNDNTHSALPVRSEIWDYVMPEVKLEIPGHAHWTDHQVVSWDALQDESHVQYYFLSGGYTQNPFQGGGAVMNKLIEPGTTSYDIDPFAPGWYTMTVIVWPMISLPH